MKISTSTFILIVIWGSIHLILPPDILGKPTFEAGDPKTCTKKGQSILSFEIQKLSCASCARAMVIDMGRLDGVGYVKLDLNLPYDAKCRACFNKKKVKKEEILNVLHKHLFYENNVSLSK